MPKCRVFISYTMRGNGVNIELLKLLKQRLSNHNLVETYIDILDNCGENHQAFVLKQLEKANVVLLIQSESVESSAWVRVELSIAKERNIPIITLALEQIKAIANASVNVKWLEKKLIQTAQREI